MEFCLQKAMQCTGLSISMLHLEVCIKIWKSGVSQICHLHKAKLVCFALS